MNAILYGINKIQPYQYSNGSNNWRLDLPSAASAWSLNDSSTGLGTPRVLSAFSIAVVIP